MELNFLIQLTETDKRILIALCLVLILVFVLIGLMGSLIIRTMRWQGRKCDTLVSDVVVYKIVTTPKQLKKYARKKNGRYFLKQAWLPLLFVTLGAIALIIHNIVYKNWAYNPFNSNDGFGTLLFLWDFNDPDSYTTIFGLKVLAKWPPLYNQPHVTMDAIYSYIGVPLIIIGGLWYIVVAQAYLARTIRASKLCKQVFEKSLEGVNGNTFANVNPNPQPQENQNINTDQNQ